MSKAVADLRRSTLDTAGASTLQARGAAFEGWTDTTAVAAYVSKVRQHAYRVMDGDLTVLRASGFTEDAIFELTVAAALGAAQERLDAALAFLEDGR